MKNLPFLMVLLCLIVSCSENSLVPIEKKSEDRINHEIESRNRCKNPDFNEIMEIDELTNCGETNTFEICLYDSGVSGSSNCFSTSGLITLSHDDNFEALTEWRCNIDIDSNFCYQASLTNNADCTNEFSFTTFYGGLDIQSDTLAVGAGQTITFFMCFPMHEFIVFP